MKTLLIMRHAKSSWDNDYLADHDRPLNKRGQTDATRMGRLLVEQDLVPDVIVSSSARRAVETAEAAANAAGFDGEIQYTRDLYHADPEIYLDVLRQVNERYPRALLIGHNPGLEELVTDLAGRDERMPTAALACFRIDTESWLAVNEDTHFDLFAVWRPKEL